MPAIVREETVDNAMRRFQSASAFPRQRRKSRVPFFKGRRLWSNGSGLFRDPVSARVADLLADHGDAVLLCEGTARAHNRSRGVNLPAKLSHNFLESRPFGLFEHLDQLGGFAGRAGSVRAALCGLLRGLPCGAGLASPRGARLFLWSAM